MVRKYIWSLNYFVCRYSLRHDLSQDRAISGGFVCHSAEPWHFVETEIFRRIRKIAKSDY
jgi:hypothetical protein